jgi:hypothetical protein
MCMRMCICIYIYICVYTASVWTSCWPSCSPLPSKRFTRVADELVGLDVLGEVGAWVDVGAADDDALDAGRGQQRGQRPGLGRDLQAASAADEQVLGEVARCGAGWDVVE